MLSKLHKRPNLDAVLLVTVICSVPFQDQMTPVLGLSIGFFIFSAAAVLVMWMHGSKAFQIAHHRILVCLWALVLFAAFAELAHGGGLLEVRRIAEMSLGALVVATLCRTRSAIVVALCAYVLNGVVVAALLYAFDYAQVSALGVADFIEATQLREAAFKNSNFMISPNAAGFMAAQSAVIACIVLCSTRSPATKCAGAAGVAIGLTGTLLSMSRGAGILVAVSLVYVLARLSAKVRLRAVVAVAVFVSLAYLLAPAASFERLTALSAHNYADAGKREARARVYDAAAASIPEYWLFGVGADHFWSDWGYEHDFPVFERVGVIGAHNAFLQLSIYWGVGALGLLSIFAGLVLALPSAHVPRDSIRLCVDCIAISLISWMLLTHLFYAKQLSIAIGVVVSYDMLYRKAFATAGASAFLRRRLVVAEHQLGSA